MTRLGDWFRGFADALESAGRSPLSVALVRGAAEDDLVERLFADDPMIPGSVPPLRLLGALHYLVLAGEAPKLAPFYPSVGGERPPAKVWPAARATLEANEALVHARLPRTVQTNDVGRSVVLFAGLQYVARTDPRPVRLLEIGASAGLNLLCDRYAYATDTKATYGDPRSPLRFRAPWSLDTKPVIVARAGCDLNPLNPRDREDRLTLESYIWPDEADRLTRLRHALQVAKDHAVPIAQETASSFLTRELEHGDDDVLTVVWHSVMRQYVDPEEWARVEPLLAGALTISLEPGGQNYTEGFAVHVGGRHVAMAGDHGPPVRWLT